jgi:hypothetical protein
MEERGLQGERITSNDQPSRRFASGRICAHGGCRTRLSIYNDGRYCALHEPMTFLRTRGKKIA